MRLSGLCIKRLEWLVCAQVVVLIGAYDWLLVFVLCVLSSFVTVFVYLYIYVSKQSL